MDYKKIIKSRNVRRAILRLLWIVPDKTMLKIQYYIKMGQKLNLKNPQRFSEKLQCYKLYYREPLMKECVDKYDVRNYVSKCGYKDILIPLIGIYDSPDQIDFEKLPEQFVIKDTLGGGGIEVIICKDKAQLNVEETKNILWKWVKRPTTYKVDGREWPYGGKKHRIIIEKYIESNTDEGGLIDYKFFCFDGRFEYLYVIADRDFGNGAGLGVFDRNYNKLDVVRRDEKPLKRNIPKPDRYEEMITIAEKLAAPFPEVRVDLYSQEGTILFGELTFFDGSGYTVFLPDSFDFEMGRKFNIDRLK